MDIKLSIFYFIFLLLFLHWFYFGQDSNLPISYHQYSKVGRDVGDHMPLSFLDMAWDTAVVPLVHPPHLELCGRGSC